MFTNVKSCVLYFYKSLPRKLQRIERISAMPHRGQRDFSFEGENTKLCWESGEVHVGNRISCPNANTIYINLVFLSTISTLSLGYFNCPVITCVAEIRRLHSDTSESYAQQGRQMSSRRETEFRPPGLHSDLAFKELTRCRLLFFDSLSSLFLLATNYCIFPLCREKE